jgi:exosome complex exonuclease DIS3/RRP44
LQSKQHIEKTMNNINKRHRLAQMAGRASVEFYVGLALEGRLRRARDMEGPGAGGARKGIREEAFVIRVFKNGLAVFVSK